MTLVKYRATPLDLLRDELGDAFSWLPMMRDEADNVYNWQPRMDVEELDTHFLVKVDLPGVRPKDIKVDVTDNVLTVSGERIQEKTDKGRYERFAGKFYRTFRLPCMVDSSRTKAAGKHGVLQIEIPKLEGTKGRSIEVEEA